MDNPVVDTLAEEFHVASRNAAAFKRIYKAYEVHYEPFVQQLVATAPLHLADYPRVELPAHGASVHMSLGEAIKRRASGRGFSSVTLSVAALAELLRLANGIHTIIRSEDQPVFYRRPAANSGGLGSVEIFPIILNVDGVEPGIYHFDSVRLDLARLYPGNFREWLREVILFQVEFSEAAVALVLTSAVGRLRAKYGLRGYRFALLDVGHVSQNIYLVSTGLGLQVCATAGFIDDELDAVLGLDGLDNASMLVVLVGP